MQAQHFTFKTQISTKYPVGASGKGFTSAWLSHIYQFLQASWSKNHHSWGTGIYFIHLTLGDKLPVQDWIINGIVIQGMQKMVAVMTVHVVYLEIKFHLTWSCPRRKSRTFYCLARIPGGESNLSKPPLPPLLLLHPLSLCPPLSPSVPQTSSQGLLWWWWNWLTMM